MPLINQLPKLTTPPVLVLDDYHVMPNPAIDEALVFLIEDAPPDAPPGHRHPRRSIFPSAALASALQVAHPSRWNST